MLVLVLFAAASAFRVMPHELMGAQPASQQKPTDKKSKKKADTWLLLGRDGHCSPFKSLKDTYPDLPPISTPQGLQQYLKTHEGTPLLYPIDDPEFPTLQGYSLFDPAHHLSYIILPAAHCQGQFMPKDQDAPSPQNPH